MPIIPRAVSAAPQNTPDTPQTPARVGAITGVAAQAKAPNRVNLVWGNAEAKVLVVCDALVESNRKAMEAWNAGLPATAEAMHLMRETARAAGIDLTDVAFVRLAPPIGDIALTSAARKWAHVEAHVEALREIITARQPRLVVTTGELASRALLGRSVQITKSRGAIEQAKGVTVGGAPVPVMPMFAPGFVLRNPEHRPVFEADWRTIAKLRANDFQSSGMVKQVTNYRWVPDLHELIENRPTVMAADTETTGLRWYSDEVFGFLAQLCVKPGESYLLPIHERYWEKVFPGLPFSQMEEGIRQLADLMEDRSIKKLGHNLKYDHHILSKVNVRRGDGSCSRLQPRGWYMDTEIMSFQADENMIQRNLDECTRVWVPEMAGYADAFNQTTNKDRMIEVPPEDILDETGKITTHGMRSYAGGDPDAVFRLAQRLRDILRRDPKQWKLLHKVQMPSLMMFAQVTEPAGVTIDQERLTALGEEVDTYTRDLYRSLIRRVPAPVRRKHMAAATAAGKVGTKKQQEALSKALSFTRDEFTRDVLFSKDGFGLKPSVFTPSTARLPAHQRVASVSTKDHLPYFVTDAKAGNFVLDLTDFMKAKKMSSTYVGKQEHGTGFWQYLSDQSKIHPSFTLTGTNTGRTASREPNGQNFPKRGRWAKPYQRIMRPGPRKVFGASDMSQIELRLVAWMANEANMIDIYRANGDIHAATAAVSLGLSAEEFATWKTDAVFLRDVLDLPGAKQLFDQTSPEKRAALTLKSLHALQRFRAKAVSFGFVYGAMAETFRTYAKTNYGVDFTSEEAVTIRNRYFDRYRLEPWHAVMREIVHRDCMVRGLLGAARHLPSIKSDNRSTVSETERQAINAPIQRVGSDLCLIGAYRFQAHVHPDIARVVLTVHDQVVLEIEEGYEEAVLPVLCWFMQNPPLEEWFGITAPLPFGSDAEISPASLGEMAEREDINSVMPTWYQHSDEDAILKAFVEGDPQWVLTPSMSPEDALASVHVRLTA